MFAGWLAVFVACLALGRHRPSRRDVVVTVPFLAPGLWAQRNIALLAAGRGGGGRPLRRPRRYRAGGRLAAQPDRRRRPPGPAALIWAVQAGGEPDFDTPTIRWRPCAGWRTRVCSAAPDDRRRLGRVRDPGVLAEAEGLRRRPLRHVSAAGPRGLHSLLRCGRAWREILDRWNGSTSSCGRSGHDRPADGDRSGMDDRLPGQAWPWCSSGTPPADLLLRGGRQQPERQPKTSQAAVDRFVAGQAVPFSVVVSRRLDRGGLTHLADRQVLHASLYKLFVARELLRRIDAGQLEPDCPPSAGDGAARTVGDCIRDMIVVSDNPCGVWGLRAVGAGRLDASLVARRLLRHFAGQPPAHHGRRRRPVLRRRTGRGTATAELYGLLQGQQVNDRLPAGCRRAPPSPTRPVTASTGPTTPASSTPRAASCCWSCSAGRGPPPAATPTSPGPAEERAFGAIAELARRLYAERGAGPA